MAKPVVDRLESQLDGKAEVIRLNILSRVGQQAAARYGIRGVPSLVIVNSQSEAVYGHYGIPMPSSIVSHIDSLLAAN